MRFKVPQNVDRDDEILPFLTMKQLFIMLIGGGICYVWFMFLANFFFIEVWGPLVMLPVGLTIAIAYIEVGGVSFSKWILLFFAFRIVPQKRVWKNERIEIDNEMRALYAQSTQSPPKKKEEDVVKKHRSLSDLIDDIDMKKSNPLNHNLEVEKKAADDFTDEEQKHMESLNKIAGLTSSAVNVKDRLQTFHPEIGKMLPSYEAEDIERNMMEKIKTVRPNIKNN